MLVRLLSAGHRQLLQQNGELAFLRMGLPTGAREYLLAKVLPLQLLVTGASKADAQALQARCEGASAPFATAQERVDGWAVFLAGREDQLRRLVHALADGLPLANGLQQALRALEPPAPLTLGTGPREVTWRFEGRPRVMGVLNVTPDSFSDGGRFLSPDAALAQALKLVEEGADLIDIGGESTRPGARAVSVDEELARVVPVVERLRARVDVPLSIDTRKASVAEAALKAGAVLVNDISALGFDERMAQVVARQGAALCLMHMQGTPETMQQAPTHDDVVESVLRFLGERIARAEAAGIPASRLLVDPGIGFGKTREQQLVLLQQSAELRVLGLPLVVGTSRKSFLGALLKDRPVVAPGSAAGPDRLAASLATVASLALGNGVDVIRVHDVRETHDVLTVIRALLDARDGGSLYAPPRRNESE